MTDSDNRISTQISMDNLSPNRIKKFLSSSTARNSNFEIDKQKLFWGIFFPNSYIW